MRWILVADSARCRFFEQELEHGPLAEADSLVHPGTRLREQEQFADRQGRSFDSGGAGRHAMERPTSARQEEAAKFAHTIAERVNLARKKGAVDGVVLIMEPRFLGTLRQKLDSHTQKLVELEIPADLTQADADTIRAKFMESMRR
jgi:protein required for attachment to host cells